MHPNILLIGNLLFIRVDDSNPTIKGVAPRYIAGSISGPLFSGTYYTLEEIKSKFPSVVEATNFLTLAETYHKNP